MSLSSYEKNINHSACPLWVILDHYDFMCCLFCPLWVICDRDIHRSSRLLSAVPPIATKLFAAQRMTRSAINVIRCNASMQWAFSPITLSDIARLVEMKEAAN
jgi:hypothetical protein